MVEGHYYCARFEKQELTLNLNMTQIESAHVLVLYLVVLFVSNTASARQRYSWVFVHICS